jgi:hypothetical protein
MVEQSGQTQSSCTKHLTWPREASCHVVAGMETVDLSGDARDDERPLASDA